jgi:hypothetical protein
MTQNTNHKGSNVVNVPPRRKTITHKGLFGIIEFHPIRKCWSYVVKLVHTTTLRGEAPSEAHATLETKKLLEQAAEGKNKNVRTVE